MTLNFFQRLSYKLTRTSLTVVLILGLIVTIGQIYFDFQDQRQSIEKNIHDIITSGTSSAQRAVHTLDPLLANEVVKGLATYLFIRSVEILDEDNNLMARRDNTPPESSTAALTQFVRGTESIYTTQLINDAGRKEGQLVIIINNDLMLRPLYQRALYTFLGGLTRNLILGLLLAYLFNQLLTKPLFRLASNISEIDGNEPSGKRINHIPKHFDDEIGYIINSANQLIAQLEQHREDLIEREGQLRIILDASPNQVFAINSSGDFVFTNITTTQFYGIENIDLRGQNYFDLHKKCNAIESDELFSSIKNTEVSAQLARNIEQCLTDIHGEKHVMHMTLMPFSLYGQNCVLVIANDISARVAAEERVERLAYFDTLTSLPNRNQLHEQLIDDIESTKRHHSEGAVLFIDIDDFKRINDTLGHSIGDELLLVLSNKMRAQLRATETLARLGGDEFVLSVPNISKDQDTAVEHASNLAERLLKIISAPIELSGHYFSIGASIGISTYPSVASDIEKLLRYADTAMYQAKAAGRNCYRVFEAPMAEEAQSRVELESEIRQAITHQEFRFHLQPLIDASTEIMIGAEALIRWEHKERGMIMPGHFIPFLERSPMVSQVGQIVLDQVCGFLKASLDKKLLPDGFRISVNVSATEFFQQDFVQHIHKALTKHNLDGSYLELEITESVALDGLDDVIAKMYELKRSGITFALDDFGTGYSSLNYLKQLPVDKIKIDKTFIDGVPHNKQDSALVSSVIDIAENLSLKVVVEGVEEQVQAEHFAKEEHVIIQGYWFDAPMPPSTFVEKYLKPPTVESNS